MPTTCTTPTIPCLPAVKRGDTWRIQFTWTDENGDPLDLSSATVNMQVRNTRSRALVATADSMESGTTGVVTAVFLPATTRLVAAGTYHTDMEIAFSDTYVLSSDTIALPVVADITKLTA